MNLKMTDGIGEQRTSIPTSTQRSRSIEMNCRNSLCTVQSISTYMYVAYSAVRTSTAASVVSPPTISSTFTCAQPFIPELKPIVACEMCDSFETKSWEPVGLSLNGIS